MPESPPSTREQMVNLIGIITKRLTTTEERLNFLIQHRQTPNQEDLDYDRKTRGLVTSLGQRQSEFCLASKEMREGLERENERLRQAFKFLKEEVGGLTEELEKMSAPPLVYGTFRSLNEDGTAIVTSGGRKYKVNVSSKVKKESLEPGKDVLLNEGLNILEIAGYETRGEEVTVKEILSETRISVTMRADEIQIVELAEPLRGSPLKAGDKVLLDTRSGYVTERLPKGEIEDLLLEEVPDITYAKIGGLGKQIEDIRDAIELPILYRDYFAEHQLKPPKGVLLYGPPGCGKTLIAKAVANSLAQQLSEKTGQSVKGCFLNIKGPELLNKYVGETERKIREIFDRAREKATDGSPVIIFFDEMDSLFRMRGSGISSDMESTIVPQFLAELDGVEGLKNVIVIGASNRQDLIDPAILRPGRFDVKIKIDRPDFCGVHEILKIYCTPELPFSLKQYQHTEDDFLREDGTKIKLPLYDKDGCYLPRDRFGNQRKFYDCDPSLELNERNERNLKPMKFFIGRGKNGHPLPEDVAGYFIKRAALEMWGLTPESEKWSKFVEITYASGKQETMYFRHFMSGAIIESVMTRVKKSAVKRRIQTNERGIKYSDFFHAIQNEFRENEELPNTTNPDDWARIVAQRGERIVNVRAAKKENEEEKKVATITTGHYL